MTQSNQRSVRSVASTIDKLRAAKDLIVHQEVTLTRGGGVQKPETGANGRPRARYRASLSRRSILKNRMVPRHLITTRCGCKGLPSFNLLVPGSVTRGLTSGRANVVTHFVGIYDIL
jgi:hypothetical protein